MLALINLFFIWTLLVTVYCKLLSGYIKKNPSMIIFLKLPDLQDKSDLYPAVISICISSKHYNNSYSLFH